MVDRYVCWSTRSSLAVITFVRSNKATQASYDHACILVIVGYRVVFYRRACVRNDSRGVVQTLRGKRNTELELTLSV